MGEFKVIQQEMEYLISEDKDVAAVVLGEVLRLCEFVNNETEDVEQVLQTRIVSPAEVVRHQEEWRGAIQGEIDSLFVVKEALKVVSAEEAHHIMKTQDVQAVPSKVVFTLKPDPERVAGKKKCRIVACGNFAREEENQDLFTSGADSTSLRMALSLASQKGWWGANLDIRTAFLNAPMKHTGGAHEMELKRVLLKPANILVKLGYFTSTEYWEVLKALYGFRQSPKLWSDHRDMVMREMRVGDYYLVQMESEPAMWTIRCDHDEGLHGLVVTYVDDILVLSEKKLVQEWTDCFSRTWETTKPEWVQETKPTRFLGMEMFRKADGSWRLNQVNYTCDLLRRNLGKDEGKWGSRKIPIAKDAEVDHADDPVVEEDNADPAVKLERVREAQRIVGELVWLVTRCRPDLMYALNRMAVWTTRQPGRVISMAPQVWRFLAQTRAEGLTFSRGDGSFGDLEVFTDASYGEECQGCVILKWAGSPILWKSSRQTIQTTSTAGAELYEIMEGAIMAEAIRVIAEELHGDKVRCWQYTDSASALAIVAGDTSSWRTKHLRRRARFLRWRVMRGDVIMRHLPGVQMVADLGTKALTATRFQELKELLGMYLEVAVISKSDPEDEVQREAEEEKVALERLVVPSVRGTSQFGGGQFQHLPEGDKMKLAIMLAVLARATGMAEEQIYNQTEEQTGSEAQGWTMWVFTMLTLAATGMITWWVRRSGAPSPDLCPDRADPPEGSDESVQETEAAEAPSDERDQIPLRALLEGATEEQFRAWEMEHDRDLDPSPDEDAPDVDNGDHTETMQEYLFRTTGVRAILEVYVAPQGRHYHHNWQCPGLLRAEFKIEYEWCEECFMRFRPGMILVTQPDLKLMHLEGSHEPRDDPRTGRVRKFKPCRLCVFTGRR